MDMVRVASGVVLSFLCRFWTDSSFQQIAMLFFFPYYHTPKKKAGKAGLDEGNMGKERTRGDVLCQRGRGDGQQKQIFLLPLENVCHFN